MSDERRTRRRFLADLLFVGGAITAASVVGYVSTHGHDDVAAKPEPTATPSAGGNHWDHGGPPCRGEVPAETPGALPGCEETPPTCGLRASGNVTTEIRPSGSVTITERKPGRDPMAPPRRQPEPQLAGRMVPAKRRP